MATITGTDASDFLVGTDDGDLVNGGLGNDTIRGLGGNDTLNGAEGADDIDGGDGNDWLIGSDGNDTMQGGMNADTLDGGAGNDVLRGGKGFDSIDGGAGDDTIYSGLGQDTLTGGAGADVFVLRGDDPNFPGALKAPTITDFVAGTDTIAIEGATDADITASLAAQTTVDGGVSFEINGATIVVKGAGLTSLTSANVVTEGNIPTPPPAGSTFNLTTGLDNVSGAAVVNGVISNTAGDITWGVADQISGTTGSEFNLTAVAGANISTAGRTTSAVETFNISFVDGDNTTGHKLTVDASTLTGATAFNIASANASANDKVEFTGLAKSQTVTISSGDADLDVDLAYKSGEDTGTADEAAISLNNGKADTVTVAGNFEKLAVNGTGTSSVATLNASGNLVNTVTITGAGATTISSLTGFSASATTKTIDASAATGGVTVGAALDNKFVITGGSGSDTVLANQAGSTTISSAIKLTDVETLLFVDGTGTQTNSIDLTNSTGVTTVGLRSSTGNTDDTVTFSNIAAGSTIQLQGLKTAANQTIGSVTATVKGATSSAPADALTIEVNNRGTDTGVTGTTENTISAGTVTANNVKNITVNAADGDVAALTIAADKLETLTLKATENLILSGTVGAAATTTTIDASEVAGSARFTLVNDLAKSATVTTGAGADRVTLGDQGQNGTSDTTISISTGAGNDQFTTGAVTNKAIISVNLGEGDDKVIVTNNKSITTDKAHTIDFGAGTDTLEFTGATDTSISTVSLTGLEKVTITGAGNLAVQAASFSGQAIEVSTFSTGRLTLTGTAGSDTIDASKLTIVGPNGIAVDGGAGADTITLTGGADAVRYANSAHGSDTINSFTAGATGDALAFDDNANLDLNGADTKAYAELASAGDFAGANILVVTDAQATWTSAAAIDTAVAGLTNVVAGGVIVVFKTGAANDAQVWFDAAGGTDAAGANTVQLATLAGITDLTTLATENFLVS